MKKNWKRVVVFLLALILVAMLFPFGRLPAMAKEGEIGSEALGKTYKVGDIIKFGHYEQDGNTANGKEEIEWEVLKVESDRVLVVSHYVLDYRKYNEKSNNVTWETCSLRKWLNNDFKNTAFTSAEQNKIPVVTLENDKYPFFEPSYSEGGNNTEDQLFILSYSDINNVYGFTTFYEAGGGYNQNLITDTTQYAINNGVSYWILDESDYENQLKNEGYSRDVIGRRGAYWWIRTPGRNNYFASLCYCDGFIGHDTPVDGSEMSLGVRPAMYLQGPVLPTGIKLNQNSAIMSMGENLQLTATLAPSNVTEKTITWTSSNPAVATVSNGVVKAKSIGKTTISAKTVNGLTASCDITVFADNTPGNIFADIKADSWMYAPAKSVYDKGYMTGTGTLDGRVLFSPNTDMNRTMFVQALYSMDGKPDVTYVQKFSDVKESAWYAKAVTWASNNGVVAGNPDGTFGVNGKATREQLALMFYKYAVSKGFDVTVKPSTTLDGFTDANKVDSWALTAVKWAVERGIISGKGNASAGYRIAPTEKATRVECAAMMNKFSEIYANAPKMGDDDLEEPLALPEEEIEDLPVPSDETEDVIIDEDEEIKDDEIKDDEIKDDDVPSKDETDADNVDEKSEVENSADTEE